MKSFIVFVKNFTYISEKFQDLQGTPFEYTPGYTMASYVV